MKELDWIATGKQYVGLREVKGARHNPNIQMMLKYLGAWWTDDETLGVVYSLPIVLRRMVLLFLSIGIEP